MKFEPRLPYHQTLCVIGASNVVLLLQALPDNRRLVSAKLLEYLRMGNPALAMIGSGAARGEILKELNSGWVIDREDGQAARKTLTAIYNA